MGKTTTDSMPKYSMPKYFKNIRMKQLFSELGIEVTKEKFVRSSMVKTLRDSNGDSKLHLID